MQRDNYSLLRAAIENRLQVVATYDGFRRLLCPHAIGHKNGREKLLAYQFGGDSSKGPVTELSKNNWRCFFIDEMEDVALYEGDGKWYTFDNHSNPSTCIGEIDVEVSY